MIADLGGRAVINDSKDILVDSIHPSWNSRNSLRVSDHPNEEELSERLGQLSVKQDTNPPVFCDFGDFSAREIETAEFHDYQNHSHLLSDSNKTTPAPMDSGSTNTSSYVVGGRRREM